MDDYSDLIDWLRHIKSPYAGRAVDALTSLSKRVAELDLERDQAVAEACGYREQHARDSYELRRLCSERDGLKARIAALESQLAEATAAADENFRLYQDLGREHHESMSRLESQLAAQKADCEAVCAEAYRTGVSDGEAEVMPPKSAARESAEPVAWLTHGALTGNPMLTFEPISEIASEPLYAHPPAAAASDRYSWTETGMKHDVEGSWVLASAGAAASEDTKRLDFLEKYSVIAKAGQPIRAAIDEAMKEPWGPGTNTGHGHVWPRPDGLRARCAGPGLCPICASDKSRLEKEQKE